MRRRQARFGKHAKDRPGTPESGVKRYASVSPRQCGLSRTDHARTGDLRDAATAGRRIGAAASCDGLARAALDPLPGAGNERPRPPGGPDAVSQPSRVWSHL